MQKVFEGNEQEEEIIRMRVYAGNVCTHSIVLCMYRWVWSLEATLHDTRGNSRIQNLEY